MKEKLQEAMAHLRTIANSGGTAQQMRELAAKGIERVEGIANIESDSQGIRDEFEAFWNREMNVKEMDLHRCEFPLMSYDEQPYACHETNRSWMAWQAAIASRPATNAAAERAKVGDDRASEPHGHFVQGDSTYLYIRGSEVPRLKFINGADPVISITALFDKLPTLASAPVAGDAQPVAVLRFERGTPGQENEMPRVISCNRLPDGDYNVYAAPRASPAADGRDAKDAARWRLVRRKLCLTGNGDGTCAMQALNLPASIPGWPEPGDAVAEFCDAAIDATIATQHGEGGGV